MKNTMLEVNGLNAWYDRSHVRAGHAASKCKQGEIVTLMGRNGAGKTTTLRSADGAAGASAAAACVFDGQEILALPAARALSHAAWPTCRKSAASCRA